MTEDHSMGSPGKIFKRRKFISTAVKAAGASALISAPGIGMAVSRNNAKTYTVQDVIGIILKEIPGGPIANTVDTIKSGSADQQVSGIVTTMFATVKVIEEAAKQNANFIIAHEPTYYNHNDDPNWVKNNEVQKKKQALLEEKKIAVWRFHDHWHRYRPDGIRNGVLKKMGWLQYFQQDNPAIIQIPTVSLKDLVAHFKSALGIEHLRVVGDLNQPCSRIGLMPGAAASEMQVSLVEKEKPDVLVIGETREWETVEYTRDGKLMGEKTSLIVLGHAASEDPGMEWLVEWLQPKVPELKVTHIASGDPFTWL